MHPLAHRLASALLPLLVPLLLPLLPAQTGVRLVSVPAVVQLPAPAGANLLLEVEVAGSATAPWLANDAASVDRVALSPVADHRYQGNLADPRIAALLPAGRDHGELFVFAKAGGTVVQSAAIAWTRAAANDGKVRCLVRQRAGATTQVLPDQRAWLDASRVERIELQGAGGRQGSAVARFGDAEQPLQRRADQQSWVLDVDDALRQRLAGATSLEVEVRLGAESALFPFALVPATLSLPDGAAKFPVRQRRSAFVPGSRDWLCVRIDDITMGHVLLELVTADGGVVLAQQLVQERDHFAFALAGERYVLTVDRLVNLVLGDDHAELQVRRAEGFQPDRIGQLLRAIEASADVFVREGKDYPGPLAAQFLIAKLAAVRERAPTVEEFVERIASRSSTTDAAYEVRQQDGKVVPMRDWLRAALQAIEAREKSAPKGR